MMPLTGHYDIMRYTERHRKERKGVVSNCYEQISSENVHKNEKILAHNSGCRSFGGGFKYDAGGSNDSKSHIDHCYPEPDQQG